MPKGQATQIVGRSVATQRFQEAIDGCASWPLRWSCVGVDAATFESIFSGYLEGALSSSSAVAEPGQLAAVVLLGGGLADRVEAKLAAAVDVEAERPQLLDGGGGPRPGRARRGGGGGALAVETVKAPPAELARWASLPTPSGARARLKLPSRLFLSPSAEKLFCVVQ